MGKIPYHRNLEPILLNRLRDSKSKTITPELTSVLNLENSVLEEVGMATTKPETKTGEKEVKQLELLEDNSFHQDQDWQQIIHLLRGLLLDNALEPIVSQLETLCWFKNQSIKQGRSLALAIERKKRKLLVDWILNWMVEAESVITVYSASALILNLSRDEKTLDFVLKKLFQSTMDNIETPPEFLIKSLCLFLTEKPIMKKTLLLIYACGTLRNLSDSIENHDALVAYGAVAELSALLSQAAQVTADHSLEPHLYSRLVIQIAECLRNLSSPSSDLKLISAKCINDLLSFLLENNILHRDEHVVLIISKLLASLSEDDSLKIAFEKEEHINSFIMHMIEYLDNPVSPIAHLDEISGHTYQVILYSRQSNGYKRIFS